MALPWPILWLIDPAGAYWQRRTPTHEGPIYAGGAIFGPDVPGGSRQATDEELEAMQLDARPAVEQHERELQDAARRWAPELRRATKQLLGDGTARVHLGTTDIDARIVRFWRGDSLLEIRYRQPDGDGESRTRVPRRPEPDLLVDYLARDATSG
jgi:uncharacterized NAD(P)/FAD-binding protein YdhS